MRAGGVLLETVRGEQNRGVLGQGAHRRKPSRRAVQRQLRRAVCLWGSGRCRDSVPGLVGRGAGSAVNAAAKGLGKYDKQESRAMAAARHAFLGIRSAHPQSRAEQNVRSMLQQNSSSEGQEKG